MMDKKRLENVEFFSHVGSLLTDNTRHTLEIKVRIAMAKATLNRKTLSPADWTEI
jgi:hypothetical protein